MGKTLKDWQVRQVLNWAASWTVCRQVTCYFQSLGGLTKDPAHITHHCILQPSLVGSETSGLSCCPVCHESSHPGLRVPSAPHTRLPTLHV